MKKILHLISSPRGNHSLSVKLVQEIIEKIKNKYPESVVLERHLVDTPLPHLNGSHLDAFFTPEDSRTAEQAETASASDKAIEELLDADIIVIGAPMYNFTIHSSLKAWIDQVVRSGKTFVATEKGIEGLVKGRKLYIATSSGAVYSEGAYSANDFVVPYLKSVLGFIGLTDVSVFRIEGVKLPGNDVAAVERGIASIVID